MLFRRAHLALGVWLCVGAGLLAQTPVQPAQAPAPEGVSESVRSMLADQVYAISIDGSQVARFWFCKQLPPGDSGAAPLGINFNSLSSGELFGVVELVEEWTDYKDKPVPAGVYTLRYAIQPADGNHTGVSPYRDYLLLLPAKDDQDAAAKLDDAQLYKLSARASGTNHPAVMALFPIWDEVAETSTVENELGQATLAVKLGGQTFGLTLQGHGEM